MNINELESYSPFNFDYNVRDQLARHIHTRSVDAFERGDADRDAIQTLEQLRARQQAVREHFIADIGGLPDDAPLNAQITGRVEHHDMVIEKCIFQSRPGHYVTANIYLPTGLTQPTAAVLFVSGHDRDAKAFNEYQIVCQTLARNGLIVLAQDPVGQGERLDYYDSDTPDAKQRWGTSEHDYAGAQCLPLGHGLARYFLHDAIRGIDYLTTRPEVDASRIGVTGNSGGGTQTSMLMIAEPRIATAAPATFIMNRQSYMWSGQAQDAEQIWHGFSGHGHDHEDILLSMAHRHVRVLAVTWDFFPIEGTRRTVERCQRLFQLAGGKLDLVEDMSTHSYTPALADAATEFFCQHLLGTQPTFTADLASPLPQNKLWATKSGQVRLDFNDARGVHDACLEALGTLGKIGTLDALGTSDTSKASSKHPNAKQTSTNSQVKTETESNQWLRNAIYHNRTEAPFNPRFVSSGIVDNLHYKTLWWWAQPDIINHAMLFAPQNNTDTSNTTQQNNSLNATQNIRPTTIALWDDGSNQLQRHWDWIHSEVSQNRNVVVLNITGHGSLTPHNLSERPTYEFYGALHKFACDLDFLGDSLAAMRTYDVIRCIDLLEHWPEFTTDDLRAYGRGISSIYLRLAAKVDARLNTIDVAGGITNYRDIVTNRNYDPRQIHTQIIWGALQHFDLD